MQVNTTYCIYNTSEQQKIYKAKSKYIEAFKQLKVG